MARRRRNARLLYRTKFFILTILLVVLTLLAIHIACISIFISINPELYAKAANAHDVIDRFNLFIIPPITYMPAVIRKFIFWFSSILKFIGEASPVAGLISVVCDLYHPVDDNAEARKRNALITIIVTIIFCFIGGLVQSYI